jgi:hypothetical protein
MKIKRSLSVSAAALLLVGAMSFVGVRVFAQTSLPPAPATTQSVEAPDTETSVGPDTDNIEEQVGDQNGADTEEAKSSQDLDNVQEEVGDQNAPDSGMEAVQG